MKKTIILIGVTLALALIFPGCGIGGAPEKSSPGEGGKAPASESSGDSAGDIPQNPDVNEPDGPNEDNSAGGENGAGGGEGFSLADATVQGSVVDFSGDGCTITPTETRVSGEGLEGIEAAPGAEDPDKNIFIHYQEGCTFQIVRINVAAETKDFSDASVSDIKKQTSLVVYGEWTDSRNVNASRIYITRYEYK